jgi:hypothetical protein
MGITVILHLQPLYYRPIRWRHVSPRVGPLADDADRTFDAGEAYDFVYKSLVDKGLEVVEGDLRCRDRLRHPL